LIAGDVVGHTRKATLDARLENSMLIIQLLQCIKLEWKRKGKLIRPKEMGVVEGVTMVEVEHHQRSKRRMMGRRSTAEHSILEKGIAIMVPNASFCMKKIVIRTRVEILLQARRKW
jgi:hypothetical protein